MTVYASTPGFSEHRLHPKALVLIVGGHAALVAAVMSAKMELPQKFVRQITEIELIQPEQDSPPEPRPQPRTEPQPSDSRIERTPAIVPIPIDDPVQSDPTPLPLPIPNPGPIIGPGTDPLPQPQPRAEPVRVGPRFATPPSQVRPPYPQEKLEREEEAALRLRLTIDERGRVVAVEPVGRADRAFLEAARRHLIANWRYQPATEDGRAIPSSTVITLRFELTG